MKYLLDTNVCVRFLAGRSENIKAQLRLEKGNYCLCAPVKTELLAGAHKSARVEENLRAFHIFFNGMPSLPFDDAAADHYGEIHAALQRVGTPIGPIDLLIASIARANSLVLVTHNTREFGRVADLNLADWE
jgi:tRNA(fMet)-specific endonuclease VapC